MSSMRCPSNMQIAVHFNKKCIELGMNIDMSGTFIKNYACC